MQDLASLTADPDSALLEALLEGVPTGVLEPILWSGIFVYREDTGKKCQDMSSDLTDCNTNWQSAWDNPTIVSERILDELKEGFLRVLGPDSQETLDLA